MKVKIITTENVRFLAQQAINVQNALNSRAVLNHLALTLDYFLLGGKDRFTIEQKASGTAMANQNPITRALVQKLAQLAGMMTDPNDTCHIDCCLLASDDKNEGLEFELCESSL